MTGDAVSAANAGPLRASVLRWLPLAVIAVVMAVAYLMGWHRYISLKAIGLHYAALRSFIDASLWSAVAAFVGVYIAVTALSFPGAAILTLTAGLFFGPWLGAAASVVGATVGACIVFVAVNTSVGTSLAARAGPFVGRLRDGFRANALSYLLFLRLVPLFPFCVVNLVPALLGVPFPVFVLGTLIGIIPGSLAYALAGAGLAGAIEAQNAAYRACVAAHPAPPPHADCAYSIDFSALVTPELIWAGVILGVIALIPVAIKLWGRHAAA